MLAQERGQDHSMMVGSVVEHEDDAAASHSIPQQLHEKALERCAIEDLANPAHELNGGQIECAQAGDGLAGGSMQPNRVFFLRSVWLKVTCVQAPHRRAGPGGGVFLPPQFSADQLERLGAAVCGAESPSGGITLDTAVHPRA